MQVNPIQLQNLVGRASFSSNGDSYELRFGELVVTMFPHCELFWQQCVVPSTQRIEGYPDSLARTIGFRDCVDARIQEIASMHYSMFMHLVYAHVHVQEQRLSWIADAYSHLVSAADLAEALLDRWYVLLLRCRGENSVTLQRLSEADFTVLAREWYKETYAVLYEHYFSRGKSVPITLPARRHILKEYLGKQWTKYASLIRPIRTFRNRAIHDVKMGVIQPVISARQRDEHGNEGVVYVPLPELMPRPAVIHQYKTWADVGRAVEDPDLIARDFRNPHEQVSEDIANVEAMLNTIWGDFIIPDLRGELYSSERDFLRKLYDLEFVTE